MFLFDPRFRALVLAALLGCVVCGGVAALVFTPLLHDNVGFVSGPAAVVGLVVTPLWWRRRAGNANMT